MLFLTLFLIGCNGGDGGGASLHSQQIGPDDGAPVGGLFPLTGSLSSLGAAAFAVLEPALNDVNSRLSMRGETRRVKLVIYDTESDQTVALKALEALHRQGVQLVIGPYDSQTAKELLDFANRNGIVLVSPNSTAPSLAVANDNLLRLLPDDRLEAQGLAKLMWDQGRRVCALIYRDDAWGREFSSAFAEKFTALGGRMAEGVSYPEDTGDFSAILSAARTGVAALLESQPAEEVAALLCSFQEGVSLLAQARGDATLAQVGWYGTDGLAKTQELLNNQDAAQFAIETGFACITYTQDPNALTTPALVLQDLAVRENIYDTSGSTVDSWVLTTWDAVWLIASGLVATDFSNDAVTVRDSIISLGAKHVGISAFLKFTEAGDKRDGDYGIYRVTEDLSGELSWELFAAYNYSFGEESFRYVQVIAPENLDNSPDTLEIGALLPLSGDAAFSGESVRAGLLQAVDDINTYLARAGFRSASETATRVSLVIEDTSSDPSVALTKLQLLRERGVTTVIGPCLSAELEVVLDYAGQNGMTLLSPSSDAPSLAGVGDNIFRFVPNAARQGSVMAEMMWREGARVLAPVWRDDVWGAGLMAATTETFRALGGEVLAGASYEPGATDFSAVLDEISTQLAGVGDVPAVVDVISLDEGVTLLNQASSYPQLSAATWYGPESLAGSDTLRDDAAAASFGAAQGFLCPAFALEILGMADAIPLSIPRYALMTRIQERLGSDPNTYGYTAWDTLWVAVLANIESGWSSDADILGQSVMTLSRRLIGVSNFLGLDGAGDRANANYDFFLLQTQDSSYDWKKYATYFSNPFGDEPLWFYY